jgi:Xaa-Pro aminopeptidase
LVTLGEPPKEYWDLYDLAKEVYKQCLAVLKPGNTDEDILRLASKIKEAGLTIEAVVIHGWGIYCGPPHVGLTSSGPAPTVFKEGQLVVVEPCPSTPDCTRGIQIGNLVQVTPNGGKALQKTGLELTVK